MKTPTPGRAMMAHFKREYQRGNTLMAWRALRWARLDGSRLPAWVIAYFEDAADRLLELANDDGKLDTEQHYRRMVTALRLNTKGRGTVFSRDRTSRRNALIAQHVTWLRNKRGLSDKNARIQVGEAWGLDAEAVKTIRDNQKRER